MKTQRRILLVVGAVLLGFAGLVTLAEILFGYVLGSLIVLGAVATAANHATRATAIVAATARLRRTRADARRSSAPVSGRLV